MGSSQFADPHGFDTGLTYGHRSAPFVPKTLSPSDSDTTPFVQPTDDRRLNPPAGTAMPNSIVSGREQRRTVPQTQGTVHGRLPGASDHRIEPIDIRFCTEDGGGEHVGGQSRRNRVPDL